MTGLCDRVVVLAAGLGTRMRLAGGGALTEAQAAAAAAGVKGMIPIGRPFLDYVLSAAADAGCREACLVIGPEHDAIRNYYSGLTTRRVRITFAVQERPRGTADAVAAAEGFCGGDAFLVLNSDNYYPLEALAALCRLGEAGLAAFDRATLVAESNIPPERIARFAVVRTTPDGYLFAIVEKPDAATLAALGPEVFVSMNCWRFGPAIFRACRSIGPSPRGELELTDAVQYAIDHLHERFRVIPCKAPVLDLSSREDIPAVAARLQGKACEF